MNRSARNRPHAALRLRVPTGTSDCSKEKVMAVFETPVLIIGGGGCGLSASIFLSNLGVDHLLVERHDSTSVLPKAHYLNQRVMEVFRQHGVAEAILEVGAPIEKFGKVRWVTSLGGDG